jgi:hypothetical protein
MAGQGLATDVKARPAMHIVSKRRYGSVSQYVGKHFRDDVLAMVSTEKLDSAVVLVIFDATTIFLNHAVRNFCHHFDCFVFLPDAERDHIDIPPYSMDPLFRIWLFRAWPKEKALIAHLIKNFISYGSMGYTMKLV